MRVRAPSALRESHGLRIAAGIALALATLLLVRALGTAAPGAGKATGVLGPVFYFLNLQPFVLLFLVVAAGYAVGRIQIKSFSLGATAALLVIGLALSVWASVRHVTFAVPDFAGTLMFNLFMFAVGMKVGPQFLSGLRRDARAFLVLGFLVPILAIGIMLALSGVFHLGPGVLPGVFAGANTATPGLGAAKGVYAERFGADSPAVTNLAAAFGFTYCLSLVLFVLMMKVLPRWFGKDVVREAQAYEKAITGAGTHALPGTSESLARDEDQSMEVRSFEVRRKEIEGRSLGHLAREYPKVAIERLMRGGRRLALADGLRLEAGDTVVLSGPLTSIARAGQVVGPEVPDPTLRVVGVTTVEVVAHKPADGKTVGEIMAKAGHGFVLEALFRGGTEIPFGPDTVAHRGDVFRLTGSALHIDQLAAKVGGDVVRPSLVTDMVTLALGLALGALLGAITVPIFGLKLSLGSAVGLLVSGIVISTLRTRNPELGGPFPESARRLLEDLGLNVFIAITALNAGAGIIAAFKNGGLLPMAILTVIVGLVPPAIGWAWGQYRLKMNAGLLTGAIAGARCSSPGLRTAQEDTKSSVPALSYPVTFAISNIVLTLACYLMASLS